MEHTHPVLGVIVQSEKIPNCYEATVLFSGRALPIRVDPDDQTIEDAIELTEKQLEKLVDAGVSTVDQFENLRAGQNPDYPRGLIDLPGVGETLITKWEDAIIDWMTQNQVTDTDAEEEADVEED